MNLAIFDLDNTLIGGDSDYLWGQYLCERHIVDGEEYERENARYYQLYKDGGLDILEYLRFCLKPLSQHAYADLCRWRDEFMRTKIESILLPKAFDLLQKHEKQGDGLLIITATNRFVTEPIARRLGVEHLLATEPEFVDGRYTGHVSGVPCFQHGKVKRLQAWLKEHPQYDPSRAWFYSDSHNDIPLLEAVARPVAVDPDPTLLKQAQHRGWPVISLRA